MPVMINGFGASYFGKKHEDENGVYVTSLFLAVFFLPVIPIASYLVRPAGAPIDAGFLKDQAFDAVQIPIDWGQVLMVYLKWYSGAAVLIGSVLGIVSLYIRLRYPNG
jgi:hypothetical protein